VNLVGVKYLAALATAAAVVAAILLWSSATASGKVGAVPAADGSCANPGRATPVLFVPGMGSRPSEFTSGGSASLASAVGRLPNVRISYFDYHSYDLEWVTDPHIGPALARTIACLGDKSQALGGPGTVVVIAHSMGGLALRDAAAQVVAGRTVASRVGLAVTVATPNDGSWVEGVVTSLDDQSGLGGGAARLVIDRLVTAARTACTGRAQDPKALAGLAASCGLLLSPGSPAARAMAPGSPELAGLPPLPRSVPVFAVAGSIHLTAALGGMSLSLPLDLGDLLVQPSSALAEAGQGSPGSGSFTDSCSQNVSDLVSDPLALGRVGCEHGELLYAAPVIQRIQGAVDAYLDRAPAHPPGQHP
jgi:triacylglycerol lipase